MRRADRLFSLVLALRRGRVVTARRLADQLGVSERTVYRDLADPSASGVPVEGEAGVGYRLRNFELPPLAFDRDEIEALVLGGRMVDAWGDGELARAARRALAKIEAVLPRDRADLIDETRLYVPVDERRERPADRLPLSTLRAALRERRRLHLEYVDERGAESERTVRPLALAFFPPVWLLLAWCELRADFRSFRVDRLRRLEPLPSQFAPEKGKTLEDYLRRLAEDDRRRAAEREAVATRSGEQPAATLSARRS